MICLAEEFQGFLPKNKAAVFGGGDRVEVELVIAMRTLMYVVPLDFICRNVNQCC